MTLMSLLALSKETNLKKADENVTVRTKEETNGLQVMEISTRTSSKHPSKINTLSNELLVATLLFGRFVMRAFVI